MSQRDSSQPARPAVKGWRVVLAVLVTIALLAFLIVEIAEARPLLEATRSANPLWILAACGYAALGMALAVVRWRQVLTAMGLEVSYGRVTHAVLAATTIATVTPSRLGEFVRAWLIRDRAPVAEGASSVLVERAIDVHTLLLLGVGCAVLTRQWLQVALFGALIVAEWGVVYLIVKQRHLLQKLPVMRRFRATIDGLGRGFDVVLDKPGAIVNVTVSSAAIRVCTVAILHALLLAVGAHSTLSALIAPWMLATLAGMIPITLAGMGTRDAVFVMLVGAARDASMTEARIVFATVAYSLIAVWGFALIGLPLLLRAGLEHPVQRMNGSS